MIAEQDVERIRRFLESSTPALLQRCEREYSSPFRREIIGRVAALLVDRFCHADPALFWEDLSRSPYGACAALDGMDLLQQSALQHLLDEPTADDAMERIATAHALERGLDEVRSELVRLARSRDASGFLDVSVLEDVPEALFTLTTDYRLEGINRSARELLAQAPSLRCHEVLFARDTPCPNCPLGGVVGNWERHRCPPLAGQADPIVGLSPLTSTLAIAHVARSAQLAAVSGVVGANVLEHIGSGVVFVDDSGRIVFANGFAKDLLGRAVVGETLMDVLPGFEIDAHGQQRKLTVRLGGKDVVLGYRCVACLLDGTRGTVVSFRDISELLRMQADMDQMRRLSEIGRMCAVVAHEIRNPLAGIMATIQSIEREADQAGLSQPLELVQREVRRLADLLTSFFGFVRQPPPRRRTVQLPAVVQRAIASAGGHLDGVIVRTCMRDVPAVWIDPEQIQQVILNLVINAAQAAGRDGHVSIGAEAEDAKLYLRVQDDGCGIDTRDLGHVFDAFYTTKQSGTGLGLSICYRIVTAHGGTIAIDSEVGRGTCVTIVIPHIESRQDV